jgi:hypothetical protein
MVETVTPAVENIFLIFGGGDRGHVQQPAQAGAA